MGSYTLNVLEDLSLPEYRARHIFIAKLRLVAFLGFWFLYVFFLKEHLSETKPVTVTVLVSFFVTTICYYNIFTNKNLIPSFILEVISDLTVLTAIVYLTGGPQSEYYIVYVFYTIGTGLFYNYRLALLVSVLSYLFFGTFLLLSKYGFIPPVLTSVGGFPSIRENYNFLHPIFLASFLAFAVYATRIAHIFTQARERMLEERNKELLALQRMSSTIRTVTSLSNVLSHVVNGVLEGLGLKLCLLMLRSKEQGVVICVPPDESEVTRKAEEILENPLKNLYFTEDAILENTAISQLRQGRIIFRKNILELIPGIQPEISNEKFSRLQDELNVKRVVAIPLVTGREVIGSLIGFTEEAFVASKKLHTFQAFADQAALAVEAAVLIDELRKKNEQLIEANRVKSEFLATMSHELRTPMTAIIGFSELMMEGVMGPTSEEQMDSLKEVLTNANSLLEMINNLLDLAKFDAGKMELSKHKFDWNEMLIRVERSVAALLQKKQHKLTVNVRKDMPPVLADEKRMQQIVLNLLSNAIKFTNDEGRIEIKTVFYRDLEQFAKEVSLPAMPNMNADRFSSGIVVCSVTDNGIGIPEKHLPLIFDVFQQVDSSVTKSYEGSGLGLALVKQFIELHGGFVWVESREKVGTKFSFAFPIE